MVVATGALSIPMGALEALLSNSGNWQTWTSAANAAAALAFIHQEGVTYPASNDEYTAAELSGLRPFALIDTDPEDGFTGVRIGSGPRHAWQNAGSLILVLEDDIASSDKDLFEDAGRKFKNNVGGVIDDIQTLAGESASGYLNVIQIDLIELNRSEEEDESVVTGMIFQAVFRLKWGV
jgi:hypothetical protein